MVVLGLTGGIASGKSTVSKILADMNIPIIDADKVARDIVEKGSSVLKKIEEQFGMDVISEDGTLNRKTLGEIVFNNKEKLKVLNDITHPSIKNIVIEEINKYNKMGKRLCVVDAALLIEANYLDIVDKVILVYVDKKNQLKRLITRDNLNMDKALNKINSQLSFEEKKKYANYIIDNNEDLEYTKLQVNRIVEEILFMEDVHD